MVQESRVESFDDCLLTEKFSLNSVLKRVELQTVLSQPCTDLPVESYALVSSHAG